jgi:hypothetical protein
MRNVKVKQKKASSMTGSTNPKNEVRLVPKKEYYGMGERELKESMKESERKAQSNPDQLMKDRLYTNKENARATLAENKGKLNALKSGLPTKKASEVIKSVGKPKPMNDTQRTMIRTRVEAAKFSGLSKSSQKKQGVATRKNSIKNPNNKEFVNEVAFNLGVDPSKVTQKQFNSRYNPKRVKKQ